MTIISERDYEQLSAFLDGALNAEDTSRLKTRLESDPQLLTALENLRTTRTVLRSAPKFRVPRNFTLTPEMIKQSQSGFLNFNFMRLTSVLASLLFVIIVMGDVVGTSLFNFSQMDDEAIFQSEVSMEEMGGMEMEERSLEIEGESIALDEEAMPELLAMEEPSADVGDGENGMGEDMAEAPMEIMPSEIVEKTMELSEEELEEADAPVLEEAQPELEGGGGSLTTPTPTIPPQATAEPRPEPTPTEEEFLVQIPTEAFIDPEDGQEDPMRFFRFLILAVEFGLGGIAIGAGITAFIMRKRS